MGLRAVIDGPKLPLAVPIKASVYLMSEPQTLRPGF
jgi:hypothetical protein